MDKTEQEAIGAEDQTYTYFYATGGTTFEVMEHFSGTMTYLDIVKAALRREFEAD